MKKPGWEEAPEWAEHLTMDRDDSWYWHEFEPVPKAGLGLWESTGRFERVKSEYTWTQTLESRPEERKRK